ncbi:MAG TPA: branched-chain amino acid ABC transporter ATP-binding protein/permease [bacterium]|nr:branched-chain amino acid ABC transporter ATP-binding protein/permease [bacterium]
MTGPAAARLALLLTLGALLLAPLWLPPYHHYVLTLILLNVITVVGLALVMGFTGLVSLGHAGFVAIGAYATVLLTRAGLSYWMALPAGVLLSGCIGYLIGLPALRLQPLYLATVTWGFGQSVWLIALNWVSLTNGQNGLKMAAPALAGRPLAPEDLYWPVLAVAVGGLLAAYRVTKTRPGRALMALRESEVAAMTLGVSARAYKTLAFALSAIYAGSAGGLYVGVVRYINPDNFPFHVSLLYVTMAVVGGMGSLAGAVVGATMLTGLPELLRGFVEYRELIGGVLLLAFLVFVPHGLVGIFGPRIRASHRVPMPPQAAGVPAPSGPVASGDGRSPGPGTAARAEWLRITEVTKTFGGVVALDQVSLVVAPHTIHGLIGPNGSGKTTLFNVVTRLEEPDGGAITLGEHDLLSCPADRLAALGIARTFQNLEVFPRLTVLENVLVGMHARLPVTMTSAVLGTPASRRAEAEARAEALRWLAFVGFQGDPAVPVGTLPFARQRAIELARALAVRPRLLLLDEPSAGLTFGEVEELARVIRRIRDELGTTVILVAHTMRLVFGLCETVTVLDHGIKIAEGSPLEVRRHPEVIRAYLGPSELPATASGGAT